MGLPPAPEGNTPYVPQFSGSSIIFVSQSWYKKPTQYTSSNPSLLANGSASGTFFGESKHLKFWDTHYSSSHSVFGEVTGQWKYYTESGANSHNISVGAYSIFTRSLSQSLQLVSEETASVIMNVDTGSNFRIYTTSSRGGVSSTTAFYISSSGKIGIGTEQPEEAVDFAENTRFSGQIKIPGFAEPLSESYNRHDVSITSNTAAITLRAPIASPTFTGGVTAPSITGSLKGNVNGNATGLTGTPTIAVGGITATNITASGLISSSLATGENILGTDLTVYGKIKSVGSDITLANGHITASGNISSSGYVSASDTYVEHLHSTDDITAAGDIAGRAVSASGRVDGSDFNTDGSLVFKGCTMAYDPAARTVTFTAAGRSVTLSLR